MTNEDIHAAVVALKEATEAGFQRNDKRFDGIGPRLGRVVTHALPPENARRGRRRRTQRRACSTAVEVSVAWLGNDVALLMKRRRR